MPQTISILVTGKVQGVFYRQSAVKKAKALQLTGIVRNQADGTVQIIATGLPGQLQELVHWCTKGPELAEVQDVITTNVALQTFSGFHIVH